MRFPIFFSCRRRMTSAIVVLAVAIGGAGIAQAQVNLADGLWGHWAFDDDAGSTAAVNSAWTSPTGGYYGNFVGTGLSYTTTTSKFGGALSLDGNGYVDVLTHAVPNATPAYSYSVWFKSDATADQHYILESSANWALSARINASTQVFDVFANTDDNSGEATGAPLPVNFNDNWHLMVVTYEQDNAMKYYVDGAFVKEDAVAGTLRYMNGLHIGADRLGARNWIGQIDDVGAWNRVLNQDELDHLWNGGTGNAIPTVTKPVETADVLNGLIAHWNYNETGGYIADNVASEASDFDATLIGDTEFISGGKFGNAVILDGTFDYLDVPNELFPDGQDSYSAATWFKVSELSGERQMLLESSENWSVSVELSLTDNNLKYSVQTGTGTATTVIKDTGIQPTLDEWHHVALTYDENDGLTKFYLDGEEVTSAVGVPGADLVPTDGFHIGTYRGADDRFFSGMLDDTAVWGRALNAKEVAWLWNDGTGNEVGDSATGLDGDLNSDGFVGGDDLDIVRSFWGQNVPAGDLLSGDPSNDGFVGGDDLDIVRANWGQGTPPAPTAVPEPSALAMLLLGAAVLAWIRRR